MKIQKQKAIEILSNLIEETNKLHDKNFRSPEYIKWNNSVAAAFERIFIDAPKRLKDLKNISFNVDHVIDFYSGDGEFEIIQAFNKGVDLTVALLESFQDEINNFWEDNEETLSINQNKNEISKIFISHNSNDKEIVECYIEFFESIGLNPKQIFCSSFSPYDIPLGENPMEYIKNEFNNDVLALFILTKNFFDSPICMCEMGAAWVKAHRSIPIIVPPLNYEDIKGVIKDKQGFKINDDEKINSLYIIIKELFKLSDLDINILQRKRKNLINKINDLI